MPRHKVNTRPTRAPLYPITPVPNALPFETISLDFITKLPVSHGFDSILTVTDHNCSKAAVLIPCNEASPQKKPWHSLLRTFSLAMAFRLKSSVTEIHASRHASHMIKDICFKLGIKQNISTAYHPRTDGQSERTNQKAETYLRFIANEHQDNWVPYLPLAEFVHNNWPNETTRESPFLILMGYNLRTDWIDRPSPLPQAQLRVEQFKEARQRAQELMCHKTTTRVARLKLSRQGIYRLLPSVPVVVERDGLGRFDRLPSYRS